MPRHPPLEPDLTRVRALLARSRSPGPTERGSRQVEAEASRGWVPHGWDLPELTDADEDEEWFSGGPDASAEAGGDEGRAAGAARGRGTGDVRDTGGRHRGTAADRPRIVTLPAILRGARLRVSWRAVIAFTVVLVCAVAVFAVRVAWAEQSSTPQAVPRSGAADATRASGARSVPAAFATSGTGPAATATGATTSRRLVVDVVGQVAHPGIVSVDDGSRVVDVLTAAGGALPEADLRRLNLARAVSDGEQVFVPRPGENPPQ
ncbi:MAG: SLBB domain-containing protein, partial [Actinomycetota bacterium]|nr:SLBB domain-containing protein [Actinomycetota bacterium]